MPRHAPEFQARARASGIDLDAEVVRDWLTPRGHRHPAVAAKLSETVRAALDEILSALGGDPVAMENKRRGSMRVDFMTETGLVVEYDEVQHFTSARLLTLGLCPPGAALGFDVVAYLSPVEQWRVTGDRAFAHRTAAEFPGRGGRQRQRAYIDAFRDLAAPVFEAGPLIRIPCPDGDYAEGVYAPKAALARTSPGANPLRRCGRSGGL